MKNKKLTPPKEDKGISEEYFVNGDNAVGGTDMRRNRKQALSKVNEGKRLESEKIKNGFRWMVKEKTSKLVSPERIEEMMSEGWKLSKVFKK